jgi:hypothetical protein
MSDYLNCPECPECESRRQKLRIDTDRDIGVIRCQECDENLFVVSVLANKQLTTVKDPRAGSLPAETYERLEQKGLLPPAAERKGVEIDVE